MERARYADVQLISAAKSGDMQAAYKLYTANMPLIRKFAYRYSFIDAAVSVDDLVQEAWFAILRAAQRFEPAHSSWTQELIWALQRQYRDCMRLYKKIALKWFPSTKQHPKTKQPYWLIVLWIWGQILMFLHYGKISASA